MRSVRVHPEVTEALNAAKPVVALESAVITHGLPREPLPESSALRKGAANSREMIGWTLDAAINLELARAMERTVRGHGAIPATIAVIAGQLCIGLDEDELVALAEEKCAAKSSVTDLAALLSTNQEVYAGCTVSASLAACGCALTGQARIQVFATGGIGGVHRNWQQLPDISADLRQLAIAPVCVVSSGAKSILDVPATLEMLEAMGVPVVGYRTDHFPQFLSTGHDSLRLAHRVDDVQHAARLCQNHWHALHQTTGILLANPVPDEFAIDVDELEDRIEHAERAASQNQMVGGQRTPFVLKELARLTHGRTLDANIALLLKNASVASQLAIALAVPNQHEVR